MENHSKALKSPWILLFSVGLSTVDRDLNHLIQAQQFYTSFPVLYGSSTRVEHGNTIFVAYCEAGHVQVILTEIFLISQQKHAVGTQ